MNTFKLIGLIILGIIIIGLIVLFAFRLISIAGFFKWVADWFL